jgi:hypothetical protein
MIFLVVPNLEYDRVILTFAKIQWNLLPGATAVAFPHKGIAAETPGRTSTLAGKRCQYRTRLMKKAEISSYNQAPEQ